MQNACLLLLPFLALPVPAAPLAAAQDSAATRGLDAIQPRHIESDLYFLADDAMKGRDTPSPEQRVAARYLRARLTALGFTPAGENGTWFDNYSLGVRKLDLEGSSLVLKTESGERSLSFGEDYYFGSSSEAGDLEAAGEVVFVGDGRKADFESLSADALQGRWAFCLDAGSRTIQRRNLARKHGAIGLLVTPGPEYGKEAYPKRHARTSDSLIAGQVVRSFGRSSKPKEIYPQVFLDPQVGDALHTGAKVGEALAFNVTEVRRTLNEISLENVCALWPGSDPVLSKEVILISAHYDHVGVRGEKIYNGADDNGSGTSGLLALADALAAQGPLRRSVMLIWVSGEEKGLLGSAAWAKDPPLPAGLRPVCNLNIDMIGRNAPERLGITPSETHEQANFLSAVARELSPLEGFPTLESADQYYNRSDQASFAKLDIPVCFLFAGEHEDYHQPTDTPEKIDYDKIHRVARLVFRMVLSLQDETL